MPFVLGAARRAKLRLRTIGLEASHILGARGVVLDLDALVVAGGGQLDDESGGPFSHPYALFKWVSLARRYRVPVFFAGVGIDDLRHPLSNWFLRRVLSKAQRVSLRDAGSARLLSSLGVRRGLLLCPDLAFGLSLVRERAAPLPISSRPTIGLSPIAFGHPTRWPTVKTEIFERYWQQFKTFAASLLAAGLSLNVFATDDADYLLVEALREELMPLAREAERLRFLPLLRLPQLAATLQSCDAVVASRLHGVVLSHICRVPVLAVSYRRKVSVYMESMAQEGFCLDLETFTAPVAVQALRQLLSKRHEAASALGRTCAERFRGVREEFAHIGADIAQSWSDRYPHHHSREA
jgi:polysaccharide pyruvyl transferase WcaK-like protein